MLISVLVITYNQEKYIRKCLDSILEQKGDFQLEILVGNDKSPDSTERVLKEYENDKRFIILNRKKNIGATKNLYDLFKKAKGEYIAVLEGDDFWTDTKKIQKQIKVLEDNEDGILCFSYSHTVDENGNIVGEKFQPIYTINNIKELILNRNGIPTGTILFKNIFLENKENNCDGRGIEEFLTTSNIIGDLPLFAFLIKLGKFYNLKEKTGAYRYIKSDSTSFSSMAAIKQNIELEKVIIGIKKYYGSEYSFFINCYLNRRRKAHIKILKKEKKDFKKYRNSLNLEEKVSLFLYNIFSPLDNLRYSLYKKKIKKSINNNLFNL
ncbi:glycosyltransferase [Ilyobacter polytropus]|uniref:Glycosyl transferase family 2 n=1 Tax=Ilyobacter polytropus (strain ATCC 51220 / DSM 2926 / LMG 16218 / CuHBu1) TaxID=572544 RepID=E3HD32_ILYPC|nr:glycosyltransferase [Ilyobacter polytropus]ADO84508.1 glycosyl transferase family 2 [Ilyobacter polytropus DSM 2926]